MRNILMMSILIGLSGRNSSTNPIDDNEMFTDTTEIISDNDSVMYIEGLGFIHLNTEVINYNIWGK